MFFAIFLFLYINKNHIPIMLRKDEFLDLLGGLNSDVAIKSQLKDLEIFVDEQLRSNVNIIKMINSANATTPSLLDGLEIVDKIIKTNVVHRDITIKGTTQISEGINGVSYYIWDNSLKYPNNSDATTTPFNDKVIGESVDNTFVFDGRLRIKLPDNTNKFVAKQLAIKYMNINDGFGYWSKSNRPNDLNNNVNTNNSILSDAVEVLYDKINNIVYMQFKLF
jgi:hypothetical protein